MKKTIIAKLSEIEERSPVYAQVSNVDLVVVKRSDNDVSVLYGRCLHRGALLADGHIQGKNLICGLHGWDFRHDTGISEYNPEERLKKFSSWIETGNLLVDEDEISAWERESPQPYKRDTYLGSYQDHRGAEEEEKNEEIRNLARHGLPDGAHGPMVAMGVSRHRVPKWDDIQIQTAQMDPLPLFDDDEVGTDITIGERSKKPLHLKIPLFVSDMSFGALSEEAKVALSKGAEMAGTGICSGEGGMLPEEQQANSRYFYELASAQFGYSPEKLENVQAFHFKAGQAAKTGTGGHLPGEKVKGKIAKIRGLKEGESAISPSRFRELDSVEKFKRFADEVREITGGIPIGFKLSANLIEKNIEFALQSGADYIILDGRSGGTGAAPSIFRDHISIPTIPALVRARRYLDKKEKKDIRLIVTGGLRTAPDFLKALSLGADGIAIANAAIQAIGCLGMRACHTDNCPVGIATQKPSLRARLEVEKSAKQLKNFLTGSVNLMKIMARACGHRHLNEFCINDLTTFNRDMAYLTGIEYAGVVPL